MKNVKRYNELWNMIKSGKAIVDGKVSQRLSDLKLADNEFRLSGPSCKGKESCVSCEDYSTCWEA